MKQEHTYTVYLMGGNWERSLEASNMWEATRYAKQLTGSMRGTFGVFRCFDNGTTSTTAIFRK